MKGGDKHVVVDWSGEVTGGGERVIEKKKGSKLIYHTIQQKSFNITSQKA